MTAITPDRQRRRPWAAPIAALAVAGLGAWALPAGAQGDAAFDTASARFQRAAAGQSDAIEDAQARFEALLSQQPGDPLLRAYAGAATAMRATTTILPWKKIGFAEDGLAQIDKALALLTPKHDDLQRRGVPVSLETRFVAANTFLGLPSMFNRNDRGRRLLSEVLESPLFGPAPAEFRASVWMRAGRLAEADRHADQARKWYELAAASGARQAAAAGARLKEL